MSYDEELAMRVRRALGDAGVREKKMFGGLAFLFDGKMACGVHGRDLIVRVGAAAYEDALARPHARPFDLTGRPLTGFVYVAPAGVRTGVALAAWVRRGLDGARAAMKAKPRKRPPAWNRRQTTARSGRRTSSGPT